MQRIVIIGISLLLSLMMSCSFQRNEEHISEGQTAYVRIDKHILREKPLLGAKALTRLREGAQLIRLGPESEGLVKVDYDGYLYEGNFVQVLTETGTIGWAHSAAISDHEIPVRYRTLLAFSSEEDPATNWDWLYHDIKSLYNNTDVRVSYVTSEFNRIPIFNQYDDLMTHIDLSKWLEANSRGYVCLQAGKDPLFIDIAEPEIMKTQIDEFFEL